MKKRTILTVLLSLLIILSLLSGCNDAHASGSSEVPASSQPSVLASAVSDAPTLTMDKASEANTVAHLLKTYKTIIYAQLDYIGGNTTHITFFTDKSGKLCSTGDSSGYTDYRTDYFDFYHREPGESVYSLSAMEGTNVSDYLLGVPNGAFTSQATDVRGNLVCVAQADISQDYADQLSDFWPVTTEDKMVTTTVFAPDDFRALSIDFTIRRPDGSESKIASGVLLYNQEVVYTDAVQGYLDAKKVTVSIQMEDGGTRTAEIPRGETFSWSCDDGYTLYLDKDSKTLLPKQPEPVQEDLTLYCLPKPVLTYIHLLCVVPVSYSLINYDKLR
ncbi:MAG: hypothetical protein ABFD08_17030 [Syntrophomonas sp.]